MLLIGKRSKEYNNLLLRLYMRCKQKTHEKVKNQKEKPQWNTNWAWLLEIEVSTKKIIPQNLYVIPNNKVMFMEQIFQNIIK